MKRILSIALTVMACAAAMAETYVSPTRYDWSNLSNSIVRGASGRYEQARAIFRWLCANIAYDTTYSIHDADTALEQRRGVCQAYCELFYRLAEAQGMRVEIVTGQSKNPDGRVSNDGHAWIFAYTDGNAGILIDPTWGAGSVNGSRFVRNDRPDESWFHVDPHWMIFRHYPDNEVFQLTDRHIDYATFCRLPGLSPRLTDFGYDGRQMLEQSLSSGGRVDMPKCYGKPDIRVVHMPKEGTLRVGADYRFGVRSQAAYEYVVINGNEFFTDWGRSSDGTYAETTFTPGADGRLTIGFRPRGSDGNWTHLVTYTVPAPTAADVRALEQRAPHKSPTLTSLPGYNYKAMNAHGVDWASLLQQVKQQGIRKLPQFYEFGRFNVNSMPMNGRLRPNTTYTFAFSPYEAGDWVIINGEEWLHGWTQDPVSKAWVMTVTTATSGELKLALRPQDCTDNSYTFCVVYDIE